MICKNPDGATLFNIPPQLILTAWQAFKAAQEAAVAAPPSDIIQVGSTLSQQYAYAAAAIRILGMFAMPWLVACAAVLWVVLVVVARLFWCQVVLSRWAARCLSSTWHIWHVSDALIDGMCCFGLYLFLMARCGALFRVC
jgi:hypothetical protein